MKPLMVYHPDEHSNLTVFFLEPIWQEYFDCVPLDTRKTYDKRSTLFWSKHLNKNGWWHYYRDRNFKIVIDHLWDNPIHVSSYLEGQVLTLKASNWIWYNESLWYKALGYSDYQRLPKRRKLFLMLMRKRKQHRDQILQTMQPFLPDCLYSYVERDILLHNDLHRDSDQFQRYFDPDWYDATDFSLCVEDLVDGEKNLTEKSFKPMAFQHAFVTWAQPHTLMYLKKLGFETFSHCLDESYDDLTDNTLRLAQIKNLVQDLHHHWTKNKKLFQDPCSQQKIEHNFHTFYSPDIKHRFVQEIVTPILEFANA